jgi:hypothetical protein
VQRGIVEGLTRSLESFEDWRAKPERRLGGGARARCGRWEKMEGKSNQPFDGNNDIVAMPSRIMMQRSLNDLSVYLS